jgi:hypothetical protein
MDYRPWTNQNNMHLAYSAISTISNNHSTGVQLNEPESEIQLRYNAYKTTCDKFSREIAAIQKYIPGWVPKFR